MGLHSAGLLLALVLWVTPLTFADPCPIDCSECDSAGHCTQWRKIACRPVHQHSVSATATQQCTTLWGRSDFTGFPWPTSAPGWRLSSHFPIRRGYPDGAISLLASPALQMSAHAELRMQVAYSIEEPPLNTRVAVTATPQMELACMISGWDAAAVWYRVESDNPPAWSSWAPLHSEHLPYNVNSSWGFAVSNGRCGWPGWAGEISCLVSFASMSSPCRRFWWLERSALFDGKIRRTQTTVWGRVRQ